uniref:NADH-ubiquinone oxidoreductase chain 6 n=1 Tax=Micrambe villosus TaxID=1588241 RepID=A0A343C3B1_9CUCU|nr:NADH dehydrogenase subunit 6 [Micrambe villosus]
MMLMTLITLNSMILIFLNHPLSMGMMLLMQTILISIVSGLMNSTFWYSYILFLIMVGGMLILFMYMTSIASNEKFLLSMWLVILIILSYIIILSFFLFKNNLFLMNFSNEMMNSFNIFYSFKMSMNKYMLMPSMSIYYILILYLLITLIAVVKITKINYGPLRQNL